MKIDDPTGTKRVIAYLLLFSALCLAGAVGIASYHSHKYKSTVDVPVIDLRPNFEPVRLIGYYVKPTKDKPRGQLIIDMSQTNVIIPLGAEIVWQNGMWKQDTR